MIPKIIHYCWFGKKSMDELSLKCLESWNVHLPDYELWLWDEDKFDTNSSHFTKEAYEAKKYAFVTDYVRLYALKNYGGIYMDTDIEVIKNLDKFLAFPAFAGFQDSKNIQTGLIGSEKNGKWITELLEYYQDRHFVLPNGKLDTKTNVTIITQHMLTKGFVPNNQHQEIDGMVTLFPQDFFCAKSFTTGKITLTEQTHTIHHFASSWYSPFQKFRKQIKFLLANIGLYRIIRPLYNKITRK